ncbi:MAG: TIGR01906 family membrane protein [Clostridia bacterium]|nr:TIGR01906 family membrane protein [Clostridia bacterium]
MPTSEKIQTRNIVTSILFAIALFFFILTFSIGLPIYCRPFYYAHIDAMELDERSGFTKAEIRQAYDEVLDYLTLPGHDFSTGVMAYSESGADHFEDCKVLFDLNAGVLLCSGLCLLLLFILRKIGRLGPFRVGRRSSAFYAALAAIILPIVLGGLASLDFDRAFVIFHKIFFPGKDNWVFDYQTDQIITVLPQDFFMHCGILIGAGVLVFSGLIILVELLKAKKDK